MDVLSKMDPDKKERVDAKEESEENLNLKAIDSEVPSSKDIGILNTSALQSYIRTLWLERGIGEPSPEVSSLLSKVSENMLQNTIDHFLWEYEKRILDGEFQNSRNVVNQLQIFEEVDREDMIRHKELVRHAASKAAMNDPKEKKSIGLQTMKNIWFVGNATDEKLDEDQAMKTGTNDEASASQ